MRVRHRDRENNTQIEKFKQMIRTAIDALKILNYGENAQATKRISSDAPQG